MESRRRDVAVWSSYLAFEDRPFHEVRLLSLGVLSAVFDRLDRRVPGLVFITGSQGVGKLCALFFLYMHAVTANLLQFVAIETDQRHGIMGVIDGDKPKGIEDEASVKWRKGSSERGSKV